MQRTALGGAEGKQAELYRLQRALAEGGLRIFKGKCGKSGMLVFSCHKAHWLLYNEDAPGFLSENPPPENPGRLKIQGACKSWALPKRGPQSGKKEPRPGIRILKLFLFMMEKREKHLQRPLLNPQEIRNLACGKEKLLLKSVRAGRLWKGRRRALMLSYVMSHEAFKSRLFRFVDVLPELKTPHQILSHLKEYFQDMPLHKALGLAGLAPALAAKMVKKEVEGMAKIFIAGASVPEALKVLRKKTQEGFLFSMDILGEAALSDKESYRFQSQYLSLMDEMAAARPLFEKNLKKARLSFEDKLFSESGGAGLPLLEVSVKAGALSCRIREEAFEFSKEELKERLHPLFQKAVQHRLALTIDMEMRLQKNPVLEAFKELLLEPSYKDYPHLGIVLQAYLKESYSDLQALEKFVLKRGAPIRVRLVKGAYWDSEVIFASQRNWPAPVYIQKEDTDRNFEAMAEYLLKRPACFKTAVASHNPRSIAYALALQEASKASLEFQFLYGMGEGLCRALQKLHQPVRLYTTAGDLISGMAYFVRRLLENTSSQSFVAQTFQSSAGAAAEPVGFKSGDPFEAAGMEEEEVKNSFKEPLVIAKKEFEEKKQLLKIPKSPLNHHYQKAGGQGAAKLKAKTEAADKTDESFLSESGEAARRLQKKLSEKAAAGRGEREEFFNHPVPDFTQKICRDRFAAALELWKNRFPCKVPLWIEGKEVRCEEEDIRSSPGDRGIIISQVRHASEKELKTALESLLRFFPEWRATAAETRAEKLFSLADLICDQEMELAALEVWETGKSWREAVQDIAEAVDFCRYYARSLLRLCCKQKTAEVLGEDNFFQYTPLGPAAIIAPWNFPLAILTGMTAAPLAAGNPVLIKPAEQSSLTAFQLAKLLLKSGFPEQSFAFLPGRGEIAGDWMVRHPEIPIISFTGSLSVGAKILKEASIVRPKQRHIKRCVAEMGGKKHHYCR